MDPRPDPWEWVTDARLNRALKTLLVVVLALYLGSFVVAFLERIHTIVLLLVAAVFFAYLIYPPVRWLNRRMHLIAAIAIVYAVLLGIVAGVGAFLAPRLMDDASQLVAHYPDLAKEATNAINDPNNPLLSRLPPNVRNEVIAIPEQIAEWFRVHGTQALQSAFTLIAGAFAAVATFIIIPLFTAYLLLDLERLKGALSRIVPPRRWESTVSFLAEVDAIVGGFIRGQVLVAMCVGVMLTIVMLVLHVKYAFLLGLAAAVGDLIPYIGAILVFVPAVSIALIGNGWVNALILVVAFVLIYEVEGHLLGPAIVSTQVKLSPLVVLVAILVGAELAGVVGMVVAVPIAGVLRAILLRLLARRVADTTAVPANPPTP